MTTTLAKKHALLERIRAGLRADLAMLARSHAATAEGVTHPDARAEGDKDMRSTEASYVARGQARRVATLEEELSALDGLVLRELAEHEPAALGALVTLELTSGTLTYFILPAAAGAEATASDEVVRVVTPRSPLGRALIGRRTGDVVSWSAPQGEVEGLVESVR